MGYSSRKGRKPFEYASKASHGYIINDPAVVEFLHKCNFPKTAEEIDLSQHKLVQLDEDPENPIENIIAIDGGIAQATVRSEFPSSLITFFQFGALFFRLKDLADIAAKPFIDPADIARLNNIQRIKFAFPTKNITYKGQKTFTHSVRLAIYEFFLHQPAESSFMETLKWFLYAEYASAKDSWVLSSCPECDERIVSLKHGAITKDYRIPCAHCGKMLYLTDVFRLHEAVDDELGAGGVIGYLTNLFEQILLIHLIRVILKTKPDLLSETLFIKDGPLAFFGQTANLHKPMRDLVMFLFNKYDMFLAGLEKSGIFVEHADQIASKLPRNSVLILDNDYIYKYIIPGDGDPNSPYGRTTYYGAKMIFKTQEDQIYVVTLPTTTPLLSPRKTDFRNLDPILANVSRLRCDMYDSSLIPVALANKLISLSDHPSSVILEKFARETIG